MSVDLQRGFRIGQWTVYPLKGEILSVNGAVHLEPKVMEVLVTLAEGAEDVVQRETLLNNVWGRRAAISDEPLTRCIAQLRRALGDSWRDPEFIETVPKRGYRLKVAVEPLQEARGEDATSPLTPATETNVDKSGTELRHAREALTTGKRTRHLGYWSIALLILGALVLNIAYYAMRPAARSGTDAVDIAPNSIAVLPFTNLTEDPDNDFLGDGLAEEILSRLARVAGLRVVARMSAFSFKGSGLDIPEIARRLRVNYVLQGSVGPERDGVRITADLVDREGYQVWTDTFRMALTDFENLFSVQDAISGSIVTNMELGLNEPLETVAAVTPSTNRTAWMLVQRARRQIAQRDQGSLRRAVSLLEDAIEADAHYGEAYVELARAYSLLPSYSAYESEDELYNIALATLAKGAEMDSSVRRTQKGIEAFISFDRWDWIWAETTFREALDETPGDPNLLQSYSNFLASVGRLEESVDAALRAQDLDPESPVINDRLAVAYMWVDRDTDALRQFEIARELGLGETANRAAYMVLKLRLGEYEEVRDLLTALQRMFVRPTDWIDPFLAALQDERLLPAAVDALTRADEERSISKMYLFGAWVYLNQLDRALDAAFEVVHDPQSFVIEFLFSREAAELRRHPRFAALLRQLGLERYWDEFGWPQMCRRDGDDIVCQ